MVQTMAWFVEGEKIGILPAIFFPPANIITSHHKNQCRNSYRWTSFERQQGLARST